MNIYKIISYSLNSYISLLYQWIVLAFFLSLTADGEAQKFQAALHGGMNISQLTGDDLNGFNKFGLHTGMSVSYLLQKGKKEMTLEFLYNQKGSKGSEALQQSISLDYLSIPIIYRWGEWYDESKDYYHFYVELGPIISTLFNASSTNTFFDNLTEHFNPVDLALSAGLKVHISSQVSTTLRYQRSINKVYHDNNGLVNGLENYFISWRMDYRL